MATTTNPQSAPATSRREHRVELDHFGETRRAFKTTEFFVLLASVAAVLVVGYGGDDTLDAERIWTLVTVLASAYMVSRGIAKAGSYERRSDVDYTDR